MYVNNNEATRFEIKVQLIFIIMYTPYLYVHKLVSYYPCFLTNTTIYKNIFVSRSLICTKIVYINNYNYSYSISITLKTCYFLIEN